MKIIKKVKNIILPFLFIILFTSLLFPTEKRMVRIAVASNLIPALNDIKILFEAENPDINLEVIFGSSGKIAAQIINGAPYDIFASADMDFPEKIKTEGLALFGPEVYAEGFLVLFTLKNLDLDNGIGSVTNSRIKKISLVNPDTGPYGRMAVKALKNAGIYDEVEKKLLYAGNVSQAAQYVITGADAGIIARSLMFDQLMIKYEEGVNWVTIPEMIAPPIKQGIVLLAKSGNNKDAVKAYRFMLSKKAKSVLIRFGYR